MAVYAIQLSSALNRRWLNLGCMLVPAMVAFAFVWGVFSAVSGSIALGTNAAEARAAMKQMAFDTAGLITLSVTSVLLVWFLCLGFKQALQQTAQQRYAQAIQPPSPEESNDQELSMEPGPAKPSLFGASTEAESEAA